MKQEGHSYILAELLFGGGIVGVCLQWNNRPYVQYF